MKSFKEQSREEWHNAARQSNPSMEDLQVGCLQRIADATEKMAKNITDLENSRDHYKRWTERLREENETLRRSVAAYKGLVKRFKK